MGAKAETDLYFPGLRRNYPHVSISSVLFFSIITIIVLLILFPGETEQNGMGRRTYNSKSTMPTHTMTGNTHPPRIKLGKRRKDRLGQFLGDVRVHVIAIVVGGLCSVDVEACAGAEVVRVVFALDVEAACITSHYIVSHGMT